MRRSIVLLWSLLLAAPAMAGDGDSAKVDYLQRLQIELVRQQAFTSAKPIVSKNYGSAAREMKKAIGEGKLAAAINIYAEAVKFEGRVRMGLGEHGPAGLRGSLRQLFHAGSNPQTRQRRYDLKRAVWLFSRDGLLPNQQVEKQALILFGAHEQALQGKLKRGKPQTTTSKTAPNKQTAAAGKKPRAWPMRYSLYHLAKRAARRFLPVIKGRRR